MKKVFPFLIIFAVLASCRKEEKNDLLWEKSSGTGAAYFIHATADSGFIAAGQANGTPYLVKYNSSREKVSEIDAATPGVFSAAWADTAMFITAGAGNGKLILHRFDNDLNLDWEFVLDTAINIEIARMHYEGDGNFLVIGTPDADSLGTGDNGFLFLRFDTAGKIKLRKIVNVTGYVSCGQVSNDDEGNIYLPFTRRASSMAKTKATIAKYSSDLGKIWETELFNNPGFSSASLAVKYRSGNLFVSGRTEIPGTTGTIMNSYIVCLNDNGQISGNWPEKKYPEFWNEGSDVDFDSNGKLLMLNRKCFIVNMLDPDNGTDVATLRSFGVCVSETSDALAHDLDISYDGNILLAGTVGGSFYIAIKSGL